MELSIDNICTYEKYDLSMHLNLFDQMLVAQSACNNMRLITHDSALKKYNVGLVELFL